MALTEGPLDLFFPEGIFFFPKGYYMSYSRGPTGGVTTNSLEGH